MGMKKAASLCVALILGSAFTILVSSWELSGNPQHAADRQPARDRSPASREPEFLADSKPSALLPPVTPTPIDSSGVQPASFEAPDVTPAAEPKLMPAEDSPAPQTPGQTPAEATPGEATPAEPTPAETAPANETSANETSPQGAAATDPPAEATSPDAASAAVATADAVPGDVPSPVATPGDNPAPETKSAADPTPTRIRRLSRRPSRPQAAIVLSRPTRRASPLCRGSKTIAWRCKQPSSSSGICSSCSASRVRPPHRKLSSNNRWPILAIAKN